MSISDPGRLKAWVFRIESTLFRRAYFRRYVASLGLKGNERLLEFGSGPGGASLFLAQALHDGGHLTCLDVSETWIRMVRKRTRRFDNVDYQCGDIARMNLEPDFYDAALIHFVLHDVPVDKRPDSVQAIARVLKPGGVIYIREPIRKVHGMPVSEIQTLMEKAGLVLKSGGEGTARESIRVFDGVYRKPE